MLWTSLRKLTAARIGLKRSGASLATGPLLEFQLAHALARRDAVHAPLDDARLAADLMPLLGLPAAERSPARSMTRQTYLMRPLILAGSLAPGAAETLASRTPATTTSCYRH